MTSIHHFSFSLRSWSTIKPVQQHQQREADDDLSIERRTPDAHCTARELRLWLEGQTSGRHSFFFGRRKFQVK